MNCVKSTVLNAMLQSQLFTKTRRDAPKDEVSKNAQLLIRAGFINKEMAGVYSYLPLGFKVLKKIENIIREKMNSAGGQEILMSSMHPKENWLQTGRWDTMDDLYKVSDSSKREVALGPTHEEIVVPLVKQFVSSYKDLPLYVYQFQNKFRMELRAKSGILRGREFLMKDMYSFHTSKEDFEAFYEKMKKVYADVFEAVGIGKKTYMTFASGGSFSKYSHEFQTETPAGEDLIYVCEKCRVAINKEVIKDQNTCPQCNNDKLVEKKSIEVGNIFDLKTKFSEPFKATFKNEKGEEQTMLMGCYGIGLGRVMGTVVEVFADDKGIVWPKAISPFHIHLIQLGDSDEVKKAGKDLYEKLEQKGIEVLFDDRDARAGEKFADSDLIGIPMRVIVSEKTLKEGKFEVKERKSGEVSFMTEKELMGL